MNQKFTSLTLLSLAFGVGLVSADYSAIADGSSLAGSSVTLVIVVLLAIGVFSWHRIVKTTAELNNGKEREFQLEPAVAITPHHSGHRRRL